MNVFPFTAVVGQERLKLALLLNAVDPKIGGVLIRGDKGSGKTTVARALGELLAEGSPFVEVPAGATEDRVKGSLDLDAMVKKGALEVRGGLLAEAHGGVLYVDEVNLLPDHIVDLLLDSAATGLNRIERDGVSAVLAANYVLVGSMNPEEGELRPQLLDRFGLSIESEAIRSTDDRVVAVTRRLKFDADPAAFRREFANDQGELRSRLSSARVAGSKSTSGLLASLPENILNAIVELCLSYEVQGLRADLTMARASAAHCALSGRDEITFADIQAVAPLVLAHRARRDPLQSSDANSTSMEDLIEKLREFHDSRTTDAGTTFQEDSGSGEPSRSSSARSKIRAGDVGEESEIGPTLAFGAGEARILGGTRSAPRVGSPADRLGGGGLGVAPMGRRVSISQDEISSGASIDIVGTITNAALRRTNQGESSKDHFVERADLVLSKKLARQGRTIFIGLDLSGSVGSPLRIELASIIVESLLVDVYQNRDRVSVIVICEGRARVLQRPTGSVEIIRAKLANLSAGGVTPLAEGIDLLHEEATQALRRGEHPFLILVTDGRATGSPQAFENAKLSASRIKLSGLPSCVIDIEDSQVPLQLANQLAVSMAAELVDHRQVRDLVASSALRDRLLRS